LCIFPAGLSYSDLEELENQHKIPKNWKSILLSFLTTKVNTDDHFETPSADIEEIDRSSFKPDNYIWITIEKNPQNNDIYFVPTQFLTRYIEDNLIEDSLDQNIKKLEYIALLSLAMIKAMKNSHEYDEKLIEFSTVSEYGIWKIHQGKYFDLYVERNHCFYIKDISNDLTNLRKTFQSHKSNFLCCFEPKLIQDIFQEDETKQNYIIEILEVLFISVPTLFKLMSNDDSEAKELANSAKRLLAFLSDDPRLQLLKAKLNLFLTALDLSSNDPQRLPLAKNQLGKLTEQEGDIMDGEIRNVVASEIEFAKSVIFHKEYKANHKDPELTYQELKKLLRSAKLRLPEEKMLEVCKAKIILLECKIREFYDGSNYHIERDHIEDMEKALGILKRYDADRLLMKAYYLNARLKIA